MIWDELKKPFLILAPMEGVTDVIFRQVVAKAGKPDLFFTEFTNVSSYASEKGRDNALERLQIAKSDKPIIAQIWGKEPEHFAKLAGVLEDLGFSGVDLNFGCPDKHVNKAGGGAAMIKTPDIAVECYRNAKKATRLPVSIKTRLGWSDVQEYKTWLKVLLNEHPAALTVHLRTKKEMSKVPAHYELIPEIVKLRAEISPETKLIINGDIRDKAQALEMHQQFPEVDGFMIGRGVFANPYCFVDHVSTREELLELLKLHLGLFEDYDSGVFRNAPSRPSLRGSVAPYSARRRICSSKHQDHNLPYEPLKHFFKIYINNFSEAKEFRAELMETHSVVEAREVIKKWG